jgi:hypothetical protein
MTGNHIRLHRGQLFKNSKLRHGGSLPQPFEESRIDCGYPGESTEARLGVTAQDHPSSLRRVSGDDQVVCPARGSGPADMGKQAPMMGRWRLRIVKDVNGGRYRHQRPSAFGCPASRISQFDPDTVLGNRYRGYGKFVVI